MNYKAKLFFKVYLTQNYSIATTMLALDWQSYCIYAE